MTSGSELAKHAGQLKGPTPVVVRDPKHNPIQLYRIERKGEELTLVPYGKKLEDGEEITLVKICTATVQDTGKREKAAQCRIPFAKNLVLALVLDTSVDIELLTLQ